ncbi:hypothetical protein WP50_05175 [Lactiplantibacillus plantarum]|nr:hypothetical protein WP50_05175 [Lactiplantibacillus plantarum]
MKGFVFALAIVLASYQGIELIGVTAGEAENPQSTIVKAIRSTVARILIFYVGAIFVIVIQPSFGKCILGNYCRIKQLSNLFPINPRCCLNTVL